ncbi:MAG: nuclear transport factor 2 family protein [Bdellovibrionota bacterium]
MNRFVLTLTFVFAFLTTQRVAAQTAVSPEEQAEWAQIRKIKDVYEQASETGNFDQLEPLLAPGFTAVMVTGEEVKSLKDLKDYNAKMRGLIGEGGTYSMKANYEPGVFFGNTALGFGTTEERVVTNEHKEYNFNSRWTAMVTKADGAWKLARVHVSMDPLQNAFVTTFRERATRLYGMGGIVVGLLFGALLGVQLAKKRV